MLLISYDLFEKICINTGRSQLLQPGPLMCGISGKIVNVLGKTQVSTSVKGILHDCVIGYPDLIAAKAVMNIAEITFCGKVRNYL